MGSNSSIYQHRIHVYTLCWNEAVLLPHFFRHYQFAEHIFVYDNGSTDGSLDIIKQQVNTTLRSFDSNNEKNEKILVELRNSMWKESRGTADWVIVCDTDEFLYHPNLLGMLDLMRDQEATVLKPQGYEMVGESPPAVDDTLLSAIPNGARSYDFDKCVLFNPQAITNMNFGVGSHMCSPEGRVKFFRRPQLALLHYKHMGTDYVRRNYEAQLGRLSRYDKENRLATHYYRSNNDIADYIAALRKRMLRVVDDLGDYDDLDLEQKPELEQIKNEGIAALGRKDWGSALRLFERVLEFRPADVECLANVATALRRTGRRSEAKFCLLQALGLDAEHPEIWFNLGNLELISGNKPGARHCFQKAILFKPEFPLAYDRLRLTD